MEGSIITVKSKGIFGSVTGSMAVAANSGYKTVTPWWGTSTIWVTSFMSPQKKKRTQTDNDNDRILMMATEKTNKKERNPQQEIMHKVYLYLTVIIWS